MLISRVFANCWQILQNKGFYLNKMNYVENACLFLPKIKTVSRNDNVSDPIGGGSVRLYDLATSQRILTF